MSSRLRFKLSRWPLWNPTGFRISIVDLIAIIGTALITTILWHHTDTQIVLLPVVLSHFFLFCNIFRIHRRLELIWAGGFLPIAAIWLWFQPAAWWWLPLCASPITLTLITCEVMSPRYHGIFAHRREISNKESLA